MIGVFQCPGCGGRMNVDLVREFTQVRCSSCGRLLERGVDLIESGKSRKQESNGSRK